MKKTIPSLAAIVAVTAVTAVPSVAQAELAFNVGAVTDYRYRGISQTRLKPAVQGGIDFSAGGFYVGTWASSIKWIKDAGGNADAEVDFYGGYKGEIAKDLAYDVGVLRYQYFDHDLAVSPNTTEVYGALSWKWLSAKLSYAVSEYFAIQDSEGSYYVDVSASVPVADTGVTILAHAGYLSVAGDIAGASNDDAYGYTDWKLGASYALPKGLTVGAYFTDTNAEEVSYTVNGRNWADKQAAVYLQKTF